MFNHINLGSNQHRADQMMLPHVGAGCIAHARRPRRKTATGQSAAPYTDRCERDPPADLRGALAPVAVRLSTR